MCDVYDESFQRDDDWRKGFLNTTSFASSRGQLSAFCKLISQCNFPFSGTNLKDDFSLFSRTGNSSSEVSSGWPKRYIKSYIMWICFVGRYESENDGSEVSRGEIAITTQTWHNSAKGALWIRYLALKKCVMNFHCHSNGALWLCIWFLILVRYDSDQIHPKMCLMSIPDSGSKKCWNWGNEGPLQNKMQRAGKSDLQVGKKK